MRTVAWKSARGRRRKSPRSMASAESSSRCTGSAAAITPAARSMSRFEYRRQIANNASVATNHGVMRIALDRSCSGILGAMELEFTKMHGLGNDFIVFDAPHDGRLPTAAQWRTLAARHTGIGFDQALVLEPQRRSGTQVYYRIFNADGGEVEQCGNGVRCLAAFLHRRGDA